MLLDVLPGVPRAESLVGPAADGSAPAVLAGPVLEVPGALAPGVEPAVPAPGLEGVFAPLLPGEPRPGVPRPGLVVPGRAGAALPGVLLVFASIRPTISTRCPT